MLPDQFRLVDGTIVRKCPTDKPLYCSREGKFYSVYNMTITEEGCIMREIKPCWNNAMAHFKGGSCYPMLSSYTPHLCHTIVALTWFGPRPFVVTPDGKTIPMEIDHLNGNILDCSADNLQYVTPAENRRRAKYLRALRQLIPLHAQTFTREDYLRFYAMPFEDFQAMLAKFHREDPAQIMAYDFTHHMEE